MKYKSLILLLAWNVVSWVNIFVENITASSILWTVWVVVLGLWVYVLFSERPRRLLKIKDSQEPIDTELIGGDGNPVIGFRGWFRPESKVSAQDLLRTTHSYYLTGITGNVWMSKDKVAQCVCWRRVAKHGNDDDRVAGLFHNCGLYAWKSLRNLGYDDPNGLFIWGIVAGEGRVTVHEHGWRAERAQILAFIEPSGPLSPRRMKLLELAERYQVPLLELSQVETFLSEWRVSSEDDREATG